jgi:hypothetical protein
VEEREERAIHSDRSKSGGNINRNKPGGNSERIIERQKKITNEFTCLYMNAQSIINKRDELAIVVEECSPDIIGVTESWAHEEIYDAELELANYKMYRQDRKDTRSGRGGGVLLYIKETMQSREVPIADGFTNSVWCEIIRGKKDKTWVVEVSHHDH